MTKVVKRSGVAVTGEVTVRPKGTLLEMKGAIQEASNAVGRCVTEEAVKRFDTDGSSIRVGEIKLTARGRDPKGYQSPCGAVELERYVYQTSRGGRICCPLETTAAAACDARGPAADPGAAGGTARTSDSSAVGRAARRVCRGAPPGLR